MMATISVVMATYNRLTQLRSCLQAISQQVGDLAIQVCVVNDGGPSIASVAAQFPGLPISFRDDPVNRGQVAARSLALEMAEGEYIALCDDDDRWLPGHLGGVLDTLEGSDAAWGYSDAELVGVRRAVDQVVITDRATFAWRDAAQTLRSYNPIVPSGVLYHRDIHRDIGDYDAQMGDYWDWDLWLRLLKLSAPTRVEACQVLYCIDEGGDNLSANPARMKPYLQHLIAKHKLGDLPSMNFLGMLKAPELHEQKAKTHVVWDGLTDIWL
jgi:glycosyltransferase involved in cell wall biosynthesis